MNPNKIIQELPWQQCLSQTGKNVLYGGAAVIGAGLLYWMVQAEGHFGEQWLSMLIVALIARWILKRTVLGLFPRQFEDEDTKHEEPEVQRNAWGEPV